MILDFGVYEVPELNEVPTAIKMEDIPAWILQCDEVKGCIEGIQKAGGYQLLRIEYHCYGEPDGEDKSDTWQVIYYEPSMEKFSIVNIFIFYLLEERKIVRNRVEVEGSMMSKLWERCKFMGVAA